MNGVLFPSLLSQATFVPSNVAWSETYPITNLQDIVRSSRIGRAGAGATTVAFIINFPALVTMRALAMIGHNAPTGATLRVSGYGQVDAGGAAIFTQDGLPMFGAEGRVPGYRAIRPFLLPASVTVRSLYIVVYNANDPLEIEAVDVGGFWEWPMGFGREIGFATSSSEIEMAGGASYRPDGKPAPRTVSGQVDLMQMAETSTTGLDFQKGVDIQTPFVWAEDWNDPASWARKSLLVRNRELSPMVGALYRRDSFPIKLIEHKR